jgi:hypothetical protein
MSAHLPERLDRSCLTQGFAVSSTRCGDGSGGSRGRRFKSCHPDGRDRAPDLGNNHQVIHEGVGNHRSPLPSPSRRRCYLSASPACGRMR